MWKSGIIGGFQAIPDVCLDFMCPAGVQKGGDKATSAILRIWLKICGQWVMS